jgi:hypothetical protein
LKLTRRSVDLDDLDPRLQPVEDLYIARRDLADLGKRRRVTIGSFVQACVDGGRSGGDVDEHSGPIDDGRDEVEALVPGEAGPAVVDRPVDQLRQEAAVQHDPTGSGEYFVVSVGQVEVVGRAVGVHDGEAVLGVKACGESGLARAVAAVERDGLVPGSPAQVMVVH